MDPRSPPSALGHAELVIDSTERDNSESATASAMATSVIGN